MHLLRTVFPLAPKSCTFVELGQVKSRKASCAYEAMLPLFSHSCMHTKPTCPTTCNTDQNLYRLLRGGIRWVSVGHACFWSAKPSCLQVHSPHQSNCNTHSRTHARSQLTHPHSHSSTCAWYFINVRERIAPTSMPITRLATHLRPPRTCSHTLCGSCKYILL